MAPLQLVLLGHALMVLGFFIVWLVFRENTYTSATIEVAEGQSVISTGPYAVVRHPMYSGGLLVVIGMPLSLASYWALAASIFVAGAIVIRLRGEERYLIHRLPGYADYTAKHPYRLVAKFW